MKIKELNREESKKVFARLVECNGVPEDFFNTLDEDYLKIRNDILSFVPKPLAKTYDFDLRFGIKLYEYFSKKNFPDFNEAIASNYDFWRYLCLRVVPDVIISRHGLVDTYFFEKNVRIYLSTLWWYIEMGFQGTIEDTYNCLKHFSTDYILQFVERPGRDGMYLDIARLMMKYLSNLPKDIESQEKGEQTLLRRLLIQNTARNANYNLVIEGKTEQYVKELFAACGVEVK